MKCHVQGLSCEAVLLINFHIFHSFREISQESANIHLISIGQFLLSSVLTALIVCLLDDCIFLQIGTIVSKVFEDTRGHFHPPPSLRF